MLTFCKEEKVKYRADKVQSAECRRGGVSPPAICHPERGATPEVEPAGRCKASGSRESAECIVTSPGERYIVYRKIVIIRRRGDIEILM